MEWLQARVSTNTLAADLVSEKLISHGAKGTMIEDRADVPNADTTQDYGSLYGTEVRDAMPVDVQVTAWFANQEDLFQAQAALAALLDHPPFEVGSLAFQVDQVQDEDWAENWKQYYKPLRVGKHLVVQPSWEPYQALPDDVVIKMDPGMAFGTGTHETTRLCLMALEEHYQGGSALDVGTGSGILAIALAKLGAQQVLAIDLDPVAVRAAAENVRRNQVQGQVQVLQGDLTQDVSGSYDFVCANLLADIVIRLASPLVSLLSSQGQILASGIIKDREQDVLAAFAQHGYPLVKRQEEGEWLALLFGSPHA